MFDFYKNEVINFIKKFVIYGISLAVLVSFIFVYQNYGKFSVRGFEKLATNDDFVYAFMIIDGLLLLILLITTVKTAQYKKIPYTFQFFTRFNEDSKKVYDKFIKKDSKGFLLYKNGSGRIDFDRYVKEQDNLMHYFNSDDIDIKRFKKGIIGIKLGDRLPKYIDFNPSKIEDNKLYFGEGETGSIYIKTDDLKHTLIAAQTGGGKSNVMSVLMMSFINNLKIGNIDRLVLVDLKGNEISIFKPLGHIFKKRVVFAYSLSEVLKLLKACEGEFQKRKRVLEQKSLSDIYELNSLSGKKVFGNIIFYIDELAQMTLRDDNLFKTDKAYKEDFIDVQKYLNRFLSLYRAMGFKMVLSTQSPRVEVISGLMKSNVPNKFMLRVNSKTNANIIMDSDIYENLEPVNPSKFNVGRGILSLDGVNDNQPLLVQVPYISKSKINKVINL